MADHGDLLEAAAVSYLSTLTWGSDLTGGAGLRIYAGANNLEKDGARIVCYVDGPMPERIPFTRNRDAELVIELRTPVAEDADATTTQLANHTANRNTLQAALEDATIYTGAALTTAGVHVYQVTDVSCENSQDESGWVNTWRLKTFSVPL